MKHLLKIFILVLVLLLLLRLPFVFYQFSSWPVFSALTFRLMTFLFGLGVFLLMMSGIKEVSQIACLLSTGLFLVDVLCGVQVYKTNSSAGIAAAFDHVALAYDVFLIVVSSWTWRKNVFLSSVEFERRSQAFLRPMLLFLSLASIFVGLEWTCRVVSSPIWSEASHWRWYALDVHKNELGMRNRPLQLLKAPGSLRILLLGDSFAYGYKVKQSDVMNIVLEKLLAPKIETEVINASQVNWSIPQEYKFFHEVGHVLKPDIVVVAHVLNDIEPPPKDSHGANFNLWILYHVYSYSLVRPWLEMANQKEFITDIRTAYQPGSDGWNKYFTQLEELHSEVTSSGGKLVFLLFPWIMDFKNYPFEKIHSDLHQEVSRLGIPFLDLLETYRSYPPRKLAVTWIDVHPNALAQSLAAKKLAAFLEQEQLIGIRDEAELLPSKN